MQHHRVPTYRTKTNTNKDGLIAVVLELLQREAIVAESLVVLDLDAKVKHQFQLKLDDIERQTVGRDLETAQTTYIRGQREQSQRQRTREDECAREREGDRALLVQTRICSRHHVSGNVGNVVVILVVVCGACDRERDERAHTSKSLLLKDGDVLVTKASEERGTTDRSRASSNQRNLCPVVDEVVAATR